LDAAVNMRFGRNGFLTGGIGTGGTAYDNCAVGGTANAAFNSSTPQNQFCSNSEKWSSTIQYKFSINYPLPWDLRVSTIYQNIPGVAINATYVATNAEIAPSLGRNLGSCRGVTPCNGTATVNLVAPFTMYEDRLTQWDLRFSRIFRIGRGR